MNEFDILSPALKSEDLNDAILAISDVITLPSEYTADGISGRAAPHAAIHLVPYGVNNTKFTFRSKRPADSIRVVARANNVRKGGHLLLRALENVASTLLQLAAGLSVEVVIVGTLEERLRPMLDALRLPEGVSVVTRVIPHIDMPEFLSTAHIFVMPSLSESMSLICVEAMQMGLPIIATPYCGMDALKGGKIGIEIADNVAAVADGLVAAFSRRDQWRDWGSDARNAAAQLTWKRYEMSVAAIAKGLI
ncbi:glycosyltransferase family 4 protein [Cupriavidus basilensis]|uniref:glycosyltransferase family 4 protein n=1 Tax=Cupriavidus basilensis TaxID=68895 RepID=UPI0039F7243C